MRYQEEEIDYLVVFEKKSDKRVVLITGYPVFFISAKNDLEKDFKKYQNEYSGAAEPPFRKYEYRKSGIAYRQCFSCCTSLLA